MGKRSPRNLGLTIALGVLFCLVSIALGLDAQTAAAIDIAVITSGEQESAQNPPSPVDQTAMDSPQDNALSAEAMFSYSARFRIGSEEYYIDDMAYTMDVKPYTSKGRSFVPVRFLAYACGLADTGVNWSDQTRTVTLEGSPGVVRMRLDSNLVYYNDEVELMDVCPELRGGRIFLPARYVAEFFGFSVDWDSTTRTVIISS